MKHFLLVPDSFKGSLSSSRICRLVEEEILSCIPDAQVVSIPVADGGEGSVEAFLSALGGQRVEAPCHGPYMEERTGFFGLLPDGTAVVEMAAAAGLPLTGGRLHPDQTTTFGVGELIASALEQGAGRLILALGGSATNDGGCGAAAALGVRFLDAAGQEFLPTGGTLHRLGRIDASGLLPRLRAIDVVAMCDIDNTLCGPAGASFVFGPQKGADAELAGLLDEGLLHFSQVVRRDLGVDVLDLPGGGAAGGMGAGAVALLGGRLQMGIETVLDAVQFDRLLQQADLVITGEGRLDRQSLRGKVVLGVARRAKAAGVPTAALVGSAAGDVDEAYSQGVSGIFPIHRQPMALKEAMAHSEEGLRLTTRNLLHFIAELELRSLKG
ncbi:glycerate kinase [Oscillibacter hominis]|uniref:Glycerate kinase n=1 Tax=Oscillibacter hominis TaxID=2763056 RepID=A0A7G9B283_9FIRM|nr:glycerate kinase [Oscillibacter hominis]QNL43664.1 glycerate kinase [Oscillibacter hominis]